MQTPLPNLTLQITHQLFRDPQSNQIKRASEAWKLQQIQDWFSSSISEKKKSINNSLVSQQQFFMHKSDYSESERGRTRSILREVFSMKCGLYAIAVNGKWLHAFFRGRWFERLRPNTKNRVISVTVRRLWRIDGAVQKKSSEDRQPTVVMSFFHYGCWSFTRCKINCFVFYVISSHKLYSSFQLLLLHGTTEKQKTIFLFR